MFLLYLFTFCYTIEEKQIEKIILYPHMINLDDYVSIEITHASYRLDNTWFSLQNYEVIILGDENNKRLINIISKDTSCEILYPCIINNADTISSTTLSTNHEFIIKITNETTYTIKTKEQTINVDMFEITPSWLKYVVNNNVYKIRLNTLKLNYVILNEIGEDITPKIDITYEYIINDTLDDNDSNKIMLIVSICLSMFIILFMLFNFIALYIVYKHHKKEDTTDDIEIKNIT